MSTKKKRIGSRRALRNRNNPSEPDDTRIAESTSLAQVTEDAEPPKPLPRGLAAPTQTSGNQGNQIEPGISSEVNVRDSVADLCQHPAEEGEQNMSHEVTQLSSVAQPERCVELPRASEHKTFSHDSYKRERSVDSQNLGRLLNETEDVNLIDVEKGPGLSPCTVDQMLADQFQNVDQLDKGFSWLNEMHVKEQETIPEMSTETSTGNDDLVKSTEIDDASVIQDALIIAGNLTPSWQEPSDPKDKTNTDETATSEFSLTTLQSTNTSLDFASAVEDLRVKDVKSIDHKEETAMSVEVPPTVDSCEIQGTTRSEQKLHTSDISHAQESLRDSDKKGSDVNIHVGPEEVVLRSESSVDNDQVMFSNSLRHSSTSLGHDLSEQLMPTTVSGEDVSHIINIDTKDKDFKASETLYDVREKFPELQNKQNENSSADNDRAENRDDGANVLLKNEEQREQFKLALYSDERLDQACDDGAEAADVHHVDQSSDSLSDDCIPTRNPPEPNDRIHEAGSLLEDINGKEVNTKSHDSKWENVFQEGIDQGNSSASAGTIPGPDISQLPEQFEKVQDIILGGTYEILDVTESFATEMVPPGDNTNDSATMSTLNKDELTTEEQLGSFTLLDTGLNSEDGVKPSEIHRIKDQPESETIDLREDSDTMSRNLPTEPQDTNTSDQGVNIMRNQPTDPIDKNLEEPNIEAKDSSGEGNILGVEKPSNTSSNPTRNRRKLGSSRRSKDRQPIKSDVAVATNNDNATESTSYKDVSSDGDKVNMEQSTSYPESFPQLEESKSDVMQSGYKEVTSESSFPTWQSDNTSLVVPQCKDDAGIVEDLSMKEVNTIDHKEKTEMSGEISPTAVSCEIQETTQSEQLMPTTVSGEDVSHIINIDTKDKDFKASETLYDVREIFPQLQNKQNENSCADNDRAENRDDGANVLLKNEEQREQFKLALYSDERLDQACDDGAEAADVHHVDQSSDSLSFDTLDVSESVTESMNASTSDFDITRPDDDIDEHAGKFFTNQTDVSDQSTKEDEPTVGNTETPDSEETLLTDVESNSSLQIIPPKINSPLDTQSEDKPLTMVTATNLHPRQDVVHVIDPSHESLVDETIELSDDLNFLRETQKPDEDISKDAQEDLTLKETSNVEDTADHKWLISVQEDQKTTLDDLDIGSLVQEREHVEISEQMSVDEHVSGTDDPTVQTDTGDTNIVNWGVKSPDYVLIDEHNNMEVMTEVSNMERTDKEEFPRSDESDSALRTMESQSDGKHDGENAVDATDYSSKEQNIPTRNPPEPNDRIHEAGSLLEDINGKEANTKSHVSKWENVFQEGIDQSNSSASAGTIPGPDISQLPEQFEKVQDIILGGTYEILDVTESFATEMVPPGDNKNDSATMSTLNKDELTTEEQLGSFTLLDTGLNSEGGVKPSEIHRIKDQPESETIDLREDSDTMSRILPAEPQDTNTSDQGVNIMQNQPTDPIDENLEEPNIEAKDSSGEGNILGVEKPSNTSSNPTRNRRKLGSSRRSKDRQPIKSDVAVATNNDNATESMSYKDVSSDGDKVNMEQSTSYPESFPQLEESKSDVMQSGYKEVTSESSFPTWQSDNTSLVVPQCKDDAGIVEDLSMKEVIRIDHKEKTEMSGEISPTAVSCEIQETTQSEQLMPTTVSGEDVSHIINIDTKDKDFKASETLYDVREKFKQNQNSSADNDRAENRYDGANVLLKNEEHESMNASTSDFDITRPDDDIDEHAGKFFTNQTDVSDQSTREDEPTVGNTETPDSEETLLTDVESNSSLQIIPPKINSPLDTQSEDKPLTMVTETNLHPRQDVVHVIDPSHESLVDETIELSDDLNFLRETQKPDEDISKDAQEDLTLKETSNVEDTADHKWLISIQEDQKTTLDDLDIGSLVQEREHVEISEQMSVDEHVSGTDDPTVQTDTGDTNIVNWGVKSPDYVLIDEHNNMEVMTEVSNMERTDKEEFPRSDESDSALRTMESQSDGKHDGENAVDATDYSSKEQNIPTRNPPEPNDRIHEAGSLLEDINGKEANTKSHDSKWENVFQEGIDQGNSSASAGTIPGPDISQLPEQFEKVQDIILGGTYEILDVTESFATEMVPPGDNKNDSATMSTLNKDELTTEEQLGSFTLLDTGLNSEGGVKPSEIHRIKDQSESETIDLREDSDTMSRILPTEPQDTNTSDQGVNIMQNQPTDPIDKNLEEPTIEAKDSSGEGNILGVEKPSNTSSNPTRNRRKLGSSRRSKDRQPIKSDVADATNNDNATESMSYKDVSSDGDKVNMEQSTSYPEGFPQLEESKSDVMQSGSKEVTSESSFPTLQSDNTSLLNPQRKDDASKVQLDESESEIIDLREDFDSLAGNLQVNLQTEPQDTNKSDQSINIPQNQPIDTAEEILEEEPDVLSHDGNVLDAEKPSSTSSNPNKNRRKLGSSRRNKGRQPIESNFVETTSDNNAVESKSYKEQSRDHDDVNVRAAVDTDISGWLKDDQVNEGPTADVGMSDVSSSDGHPGSVVDRRIHEQLAFVEEYWRLDMSKANHQYPSGFQNQVQEGEEKPFILDQHSEFQASSVSEILSQVQTGSNASAGEQESFLESPLLKNSTYSIKQIEEATGFEIVPQSDLTLSGDVARLDLKPAEEVSENCPRVHVKENQQTPLEEEKILENNIRDRISRSDLIRIEQEDAIKNKDVGDISDNLSSVKDFMGVPDETPSALQTLMLDIGHLETAVEEPKQIRPPEESHNTQENISENSKQKKRKLGSTRRSQLNRKQEDLNTGPDNTILINLVMEDEAPRIVTTDTMTRQNAEVLLTNVGKEKQETTDVIIIQDSQPTLQDSFTVSQPVYVDTGKDGTREVGISEPESTFFSLDLPLNPKEDIKMFQENTRTTPVVEERFLNLDTQKQETLRQSESGAADLTNSFTPGDAEQKWDIQTNVEDIDREKDSNRRRKFGSTRKNLRNVSNLDELSRKQQVDSEEAEAPTNAFDTWPGLEKEFTVPEPTGENSLLDISLSPRQEAPTLQTGEESEAAMSWFTPHHVAAKHDLDAESAPGGGRRRKMGSSRKSHGGLIQERQARETAGEIETIEEGREQDLDNQTEVKEIHKPFMEETKEGNRDKALQQEKSRSSREEPRSSLLDNTVGFIGDCYNVVLVGDSSVGKTSFMRRAQSGKFSLDTPPSIGIDTCFWTVIVDDSAVVLQLWDTAGQERFHSITKNFFHKAQAFLLMYDITSFESFTNVHYWANCIKEGAVGDVSILLLGNKCDEAARQVKTEDAESLAKEYNMDFMECSAASGDNIIESLEVVARLVSQKADRRERNVLLNDDTKQKKKSGCC